MLSIRFSTCKVRFVALYRPSSIKFGAQNCVKIAFSFPKKGNIIKASQSYLKAIQMDQKQADYWFKYAALLFDLGKLKEAYRFLSNIDRANRTPEVLKLGGMGETSKRFLDASASL